MLIPIYRHKAEEPERYSYDTNQAPDGVVAFYAFQTQEPGAIPIYLYTTENLYRLRYDTEGKDEMIWNNETWKNAGIALYACSTPQAGTVPIYEHKSKASPDRYYYDMQIAGRDGWDSGRVVFHAYPIKLVRDLYVVAHQDDDLLFMSPNLLTSIASRNTVKTIYLTAGDGNKEKEDPTFWKRREAGVEAAYAKMANVADDWELTSGKIPEFKLKGIDNISLVFFRLPSTSTENGDGPSYHNESLAKLWKGDIPTISPIDDNSVKYSKGQLIEALAKLFIEFRPDRINTLDSTGETSCSNVRGDPSKCLLTYPTGEEYVYDHIDHYYSARFALAAQGQALTSPPDEFWGCQFRRYRGYNVAALEPKNIISKALTDKKTVFFDVYGPHDGYINPTNVNYQAWAARQYFTDES